MLAGVLAQTKITTLDRHSNPFGDDVAKALKAAANQRGIKNNL